MARVSDPKTATAFANESANDRPGIGCIGTGSMGLGDAIGHAQFGDILAVNMVHKGLLGEITKVTAGINGSPVGGPFPIESPYGGKFTDWGAHHVDIAQWALGEDAQGKGPIEINGVDARHPVPYKDGYPTVDDEYNTAYDFSVPCRFASGVELIVTSRGDNGILFEGTKGRMFVNRQKITGTPIEEGWDKDQFGDDDLKALYKGKPFEGHKQNFYRCIREGGLPVSDVFSHVIAMNTCHLAAIAARLRDPTGVGRETNGDHPRSHVITEGR